MHLLIVEDNAFNAYCLQRLLETLAPGIKIHSVSNSVEAIAAVKSSSPDCIVLDGDLGISDGLNCNGPALADLIWKHHPQMHIIAWTDSEVMRSAFNRVYQQHDKPFNEYSCWTKIVSQERVRKSLFNRAYAAMPKKPAFEESLYL